MCYHETRAAGEKPETLAPDVEFVKCIGIERSIVVNLGLETSTEFKTGFLPG